MRAHKTTLARKIEPGFYRPMRKRQHAGTVITIDGGFPCFHHASLGFWRARGVLPPINFPDKKSLYVLCAMGERGQFDSGSRCGNIGQDSRLLMVVNQKGAMQPNLPMSDLRRDYPNIQEGKPIVINLATDREAVVACAST